MTASVLSSSEEILFAYESVDLATQEPIIKHYKCKTFPDFVDWILLSLGKDPLLEKLQAAFYNDHSMLLTPAGMIVNGDVTRPIAKNNL